MRNWHHKVIKLDKARDLLTATNKFGSCNIYVGVIEGQIEFQPINNSALLAVNYKPAHPSFSDISNSRKVFIRDKDNGKFTQDITLFDPASLSLLTLRNFKMLLFNKNSPKSPDFLLMLLIIFCECFWIQNVNNRISHFFYL
jgi:hypothetical protein